MSRCLANGLCFSVIKKMTLFFLIFRALNVSAQTAKLDSVKPTENIKFRYNALIIPSVLIGYGIVGLESHSLQFVNTDTRNEIAEHADGKFRVDDFLQYAAVASVYGLNGFGVEGKNNFNDRTVILATAYLITAGTVVIIKKTGNVERPDGSSKNSFPSGHTATAFMGAELLYQEYKDVSMWYGVSGYLVAIGTGGLRLYNNRHWLTDVAAGAGIGMLSTKIAYWVHPVLKKIIFKGKDKTSGVMLPFYDGTVYGLSTSIKF